MSRICVLFVALITLRCVCRAAESPPPNILVIISDEHNAGVMGCMGDPIARTPNLDALASRGVLFNAHYCSSPICTPSRQTLTTGKYVCQHNIWTNTLGVPESWPTLPKLLNSAGYESYLIGKMHYKGGRNYGFTLLDHPKKAGAAKDNGDDKEVVVTEPKLRARHRLGADEFPDRGDKLGGEFNPLGASEMEADFDLRRRDDALKFLRERQPGGKPFFLVVGYIAPHYPLVAPTEYLEHFTGKVPMPEIPAGYLETLPLNYKHLRNDRQFERVPSAIVRSAREAYYARVEWADKQIGAVLDALQASPLRDNTIVVYMSDHGENMGEHGLWWKNCMYDCAARVPLIVSSPKRWAGGQLREGACGSVDLVQTLCEVAGAHPPADWNGQSMLHYLDDPKTPWRDLAVSEFYGGYISSGMAMIRQGEWKYVYHTRADATHGPERELYNLRADPKELHNLAGDAAQSERLNQMHASLAKELGEDPERTETRWRNGATPERPERMLNKDSKK